MSINYSKGESDTNVVQQLVTTKRNKEDETQTKQGDTEDTNMVEF